MAHAWAWPVMGGILGFGLGMLDYFLVRALDVEMMRGELDVSLGVVLFFALNIGALGALIGWLRVQRVMLHQKNERIRSQQADLIAQARALVEKEALATIGRLSSGVAHEVRNPLAIIRASAALITEEIPEAQRSHEVACFIRDEVDRLDGFVGRLMDYTRRLEPEPRTLQVDALITRLRQLTCAHPRVVQQEIAIAWPEDLRAVTCVADEDLLERQLLTILHNALEAASGRVELRVVVDAQGLLSRVEVVDDGPGIPGEDRERIFEPFFTTKSTGTGLGLAMARKIAALHRHTITCEAAHGGAHFVLNFTSEREVL